MMSDLSKKLKGFVGEFSVRRILENLPADKYFLLNDKLLKNNSMTTQIDHVVASIYGVFVIETKNYSGTIYGYEYANNWTQYIGGKKFPVHNPIKQNYAHIEAIKKLYPHFKDLPFISIIVFPNNIKLNIQSDKAHVIHAAQLLSTISSYKEPTCTYNDMYTIRHLMNESNNENILGRFSHNRNVKILIESKKLSKPQKKITVSATFEVHTCSKCGKKMLYHAKGRYGPYYSCEECKINISVKKLKG